MGISVTGSANFKVTFLKMFVGVSFASRFCYDFYARVQKFSSVVMCTVSLYVIWRKVIIFITFVLQI